MSVGKNYRERRGRRNRNRVKEVVVIHDDGEGNWLVSYADLMTLLFGFFVILSSFSTPEPKKLEDLKKRTAVAMGAEYVKPFEELSEEVKKLLSEIEVEKDVKIEQTSEGVTIISRGTLFFDSGSANLKPAAEKLMANLAHIVSTQAKGFRVVVEGHTDDVPIATAAYPSNWELSSARAGTVVRLLEKQGINRRDLRPVGLADIEPIVPNRAPSGQPIPNNQAENRRIVIRIQKKLPPRFGGAKGVAAVEIPSGYESPAKDTGAVPAPTGTEPSPSQHPTTPSATIPKSFPSLAAPGGE